MNVFTIPSWYPSETNPLPGIFFREQGAAMANHFDDIKIGISTWGQNDAQMLLWAKNPFEIIPKLLRKPRSKSQIQHRNNLVEYITPTFTWTSKLFKGNISQIIKSNMYNLKQFEATFGKPDIIHSHVGYPAGYIAKKLSEIHGIPYVIMEQMSPFPHKYYLSKSGSLHTNMKLSYDHSTQNIAISEASSKKMERFGIKNLTVIPNLIDEDYFKPALRHTKNEKFTFFSLGRMVPQKGIDILLKAFAKNKLDVNLRIGGGGEYLSSYKKLAIDLGIEKNIEWLGEIDKSVALDEYQNCDAFVLPSRHESMGIVFAEAMACGKPVITTMCGGPEEFINDDCGYLVEPENEIDLAQAMEKMIENHNHFNPEKIRAHFISRFSKRIVCEKIRDVYENAIDLYHKKY